MHDGFESDDALGRWVRIDGDWRWRDGKLIALVRSGGLALFDELDSARPEMLARIHSLLENPRQISLPEAPRRDDHRLLRLRFHRHVESTRRRGPRTRSPNGRPVRSSTSPRLRRSHRASALPGHERALGLSLAAFATLGSTLPSRLDCSSSTTRTEESTVPCVALQLLLNGFEPDEREVASEAFASLAHARPTPHSPPTLRVGGPKK